MSAFHDSEHERLFRADDARGAAPGHDRAPAPAPRDRSGADERSAHGPTLCSNDNPAWDAGTLPCHTATLFEGVADLGDVVRPVSPIRHPSENTSWPTFEEEEADVTFASSPSRSPSVSPSRPAAPPSESPSASPSDRPSEHTSLPPRMQPALTVDTVNATTYPSFYSCDAASEKELVQGRVDSDSSAKAALPVRFDYEIYTSVSSNIPAVLRTFERRLAHSVAVLAECATVPDVGDLEGMDLVELARGGVDGLEVGQRLPFGGRRTLQHEPYEVHRLLGMSMNPLDELDTELLQCASSKTLGIPSVCSPVIGAMTVWMTATQQRHLRHIIDTADQNAQEVFLRNAVQAYIEDNAALYVDSDLLHVAYIGRRDLIGSAPDGSEALHTVSAGKGTGANPVRGVVTWAAAGLSVVLLALGMALAYHRRRRRADSTDADLDVETGAFPRLTPASTGNSNVTNGERTEKAPPPYFDDEALLRGREPEPLAMAGALAHRTSSSPLPPDDADATPDMSPLSDLTEERPHDLPGDVAPAMPFAKGEDEDRADSATPDILGHNRQASPAPPKSPFEDDAVEGHEGHGTFDATRLTDSCEDKWDCSLNF